MRSAWSSTRSPDHPRSGRRDRRAPGSALAFRGHRRHPAPRPRGLGNEYYASLRTAAALERSEVAIVVIDAREVLAEQDQRIISMVVDAGRALVLAFNKWDLVDEERRRYLDREIDRDLVRVTWAPRVNISARTGRHIDRLVPALDASLAGWDARVPTGRLNAWLSDAHRCHSAAQCAAASSRVSCSPPRPRPGHPPSCSSRPASWRQAIGASSSGGCAKSSGSWAPPSTSPYASASAGGPDPRTVKCRCLVRHSGIGTWRSLVAHLTGGQGVVGSNPAVPTVLLQVTGLLDPPPR